MKLDLPDDLPRGDLDIGKYPSQVIYKTVEELRRIPPEFYRICDDEIAIARDMKLYAENEYFASAAAYSRWLRDEATGRIVPVWMYSV